MSALSFAVAAVERGQNDCVVVSGQAFSFETLAERVNATVHWLIDQGVTPGQTELVAITPALTLDSAILMYALLELGAPMMLLHSKWTQRERQQALDMGEVTLALDENWQACESSNTTKVELDDLDDESCAAIIFTSGTTSQPKGVMLSRRALMASARASEQALHWEQGDRWLLALPPSHVGGLCILVRSLIARRCVVLADEGRFDAATFANQVRRDNVTIASMVPTMLKRVVDLHPPQTCPPSMRIALVGGAALRPKLRAQAIGANWPLRTTYGCSEACSQIATQVEDHAYGLGVGKALPGTAIRIVDDEIQIQADTLMSGYLGGGDDTQTWTSDGWYRTGDLGFVDEAEQLHVLGRRDELVITGGENVSPAEVEATLGDCEGVDEICVFGVEDEEWGQRVAVVIVAGPSFSVSGLGELALEKLAAHKRPTLYCAVDRLIERGIGKIDRKATAASVRNLLRPLK